MVKGRIIARLYTHRRVLIKTGLLGNSHESSEDEDADLLGPQTWSSLNYLSHS